MSESLFISYSRRDAEQFALKLADSLIAGPPQFPVWLDVRDLKTGRDWDDQISAAVKSCQCVLFVMSEDSVEPKSECKFEWTRALRYNKPVVPLLLEPDVEAPPRLGNRQYIDFSLDYKAALARLRLHLSWLGSREGRLQSLEDRLADARRDLRWARDPRHKSKLENSIDEINGKLAELRQDGDGRSHAPAPPPAKQDAPSAAPSVEASAPVPQPATGPSEDDEDSTQYDKMVDKISAYEDVYAFDTEDPPPDIWFKRLRPVLHQASHYSVPTYYLDDNLKVIDWNVAFELIFGELVGRIRYKHVNWFIAQLQNCDEVFEHARRFTRKVRQGALPLVDVEPLHYHTTRYGGIQFEKVASPFHDRHGRLCGWTVALMIRNIHWEHFLRDLRKKLWHDKLWSLYSYSYDPVLLRYPGYRQLIGEIASVVPHGSLHVVDLGAGTGNVTRALLDAGHRVTAVENNVAMLEWLRAKRFDGKRVTVAKASVEHLGMLGEKSFDAATMMNVLYAVDDPYQCLIEISQVLKPGAVFSYSTTHSEVRLRKLLDSIKEALQKHPKYHRLLHHYENLREANEEIEKSIARRHTREEYLDWTRDAGFELLREPWDSYEGAVMVVHARKR